MKRKPLSRAESHESGYDGLDRLTSASKSGTSQGWTYDANGNRLTETGSAPSSYTNSGTSNRVSSISGALARSYNYDAAGNMLGFGSATFTYNNRGRMQTASNAGTTATYTYNALGQRIRRATSSVTTLYVYDEAGHLIGEYTATGSLIQETVWLGDIPVATLRPNGAGGVNLFYVHADHLNTPRLVTDTSNNIRGRWDSDPFGTTPPNQNPSGLGVFEYNLRFPGQQYDQIVGLHYNYFRDYDPNIGRYVESDPIGLDGGTNTYAYGGGNPLTNIDELGLAYFAKRALSNMPWMGQGSCAPGSVDDELNTEVSHEHLFFEDGKSPANIGHGPDGLFTEKSSKGYRCRSGSFNDCVMRKAVSEVRPRPYCLLGALGKKDKYNCQDWAEEVRRAYARLMRDESVKCECKLQ